MDIENNIIRIFVDADACPVKAEIYRVAERHNLSVVIVANSYIAIPRDAERVERVIVSDKLDAADDWIAENSRPGIIVITADIPLAAEVLEKGAAALNPRGERYTPATIREKLTLRDFMDTLRASGVQTGGPDTLSQRDRQLFAAELDKWLLEVKRRTA